MDLADEMYIAISRAIKNKVTLEEFLEKVKDIWVETERA